MQDGNQKHMLVSERALSAEGGYQETNIAPHTPNSDTHKGLCENIPKQGDVGHVIYSASLLSRISVQTEGRKGSTDGLLRV